jgi:hypothetical protein
VFISYRREDLRDAELLKEYFAIQFEEGNVFLDVEGIPAGAKFSEDIADSIRDCDVLVALIGRSWIELIQKNAIEEVDHVRNEIALALKLDKMVVPVCIGGAQIPDAQQMHWQVRPMMAHNARVLSDPLKGAEMKRLTKSIEEELSKREVKQVGAALDEISPAPGLALGYFVNLVQKTLGLITQKTSEGDRYANSIEIKELDGPSFSLTNDLLSDLRLYIVLPPRLSCFQDEKVKSKLEGLAWATIPRPNSDRPPQYRVCKINGQYGLIDFPGPLNVVDEWIKRRKARSTSDQPLSNWENLEAAELHHFGVVLRFWVDDLSQKPEFRDRVRLVDLDWFEHL